ncbi:rhodanese-like domain-containing protein [Chitinophaga sp. sic0106]|uniref:rhodanese-like domain-containing protein n=1 Tax=Chitinophaga sp. sic0106 TaxID=2854785 RepID=UPI001C439D4E|nr:rhodanese-like domain-containing protein [Chitinophaga sp. sic0106]MBV7533418.1 thioredoxin fold domain-containing protein [Chitinophaga sp. sic0106]
MRKLLTISVLLLAGLGVFAQDKQREDAAAFARDIAQPGVQVFDVRTAAEFRTGYLPNALQADYTRKDEFLDRVKYLHKDQPVYIYCLSGGRSSAAAKWMRENGFTNVVELEGGINAWKQAGMTVSGAKGQQPQMGISTYLQEVQTKGWVLTDVGAAWCPPCKQMEPVLQALLRERKDVKLVKVDGGNDTEVMQSVNAAKLPTFIIYKDGEEQGRLTGVVSKEELNAMMK